ncbi:MAG: hypothetical protein ABIS01_15480 [Ferruginibacter sp.]
MEQYWFKKTEWAYFPIHPVGYVVTLLAAIFMIPVITAILRNGHSISDDLYQVFVYGTCTAFWWKWIAEKTSHAK